MKKLFLSMILCLSLNNSIQAQQAYTNLLEKAKSTLNDQNAYPMVKQISQFKKDALEYLSMKMKTDMPDSSTNYLDKQALALDNFVNYYIQNLLNSQSQPAAYQVKIMKIFMDATVSNPLFLIGAKVSATTFLAKGVAYCWLSTSGTKAGQANEVVFKSLFFCSKFSRYMPLLMVPSVPKTPILPFFVYLLAALAPG